MVIKIIIIIKLTAITHFSLTVGKSSAPELSFVTEPK
jgi:hypothetical protein